MNIILSGEHTEDDNLQKQKEMEAILAREEKMEKIKKQMSAHQAELDALQREHEAETNVAAS